MNTADLLRMRLRSQLVVGSAATSPHAVVSHLLGVQAQDYGAAVWAVGLRLPGSTLADVERAIAERTIVRTWPMRGTLHFVAAEDVRWLLGLLAPRTLAGALGRQAQLGLDAGTLERARELFSAALEGGRRLTRPEAMALLQSGGVATDGQRGYHILWHLAHQGLIVVGPMQGKQQTFVLLDEWIAPGTAEQDAPPRVEALARLAARFFRGHGPATVDDLARWAGVTKREAKVALAEVAGGLTSGQVEGAVYWFASEVADSDIAGSTAPADAHRAASEVRLLPAFDEYMVGYRGREQVLGEHLDAYGARIGSNGLVAPAIIVDGRALGAWKRTLKPRTVTFKTEEFQPLTTEECAGLAAEQERYARFVSRDVAES